MRYLLLFLFLPNFLFAQWQLIDGPHAVNSTGIAKFENIWYAASDRGLIESTDHGTNWSINPISGNQSSVSRLFSNDGMALYFRNYSTDLYLTKDSGTSWQHIVVDTARPAVAAWIGSAKIVVQCVYGGLYLSLDSGNTWNELTPGSPNTLIRSYIFEGTLYCLHNASGIGQGGAFYSNDNGLTWTQLPSTGISGTVFPTQLYRWGNQFFMMSNNALYKSVDGGSTWSTFITGLAGFSFAIPHSNHFFVEGDKIYFSVNRAGGLFVSDTSSAQFISANTGFPLEGFAEYSISKDDTVYAATNSGIYKSYKSNHQWVFSNYGIKPMTLQSIAANGSSLFTASSFGTSSSTDNGDNFTESAIATDSRNFSKTSNSIIAASAFGIKTTDNGATWVNLNFPYGYFSQQLTDVAESGLEMIGINIDNTIKKSIDGGLNWSAFTSPTTQAINRINANAGVFYLGCQQGLYTSQGTSGPWVLRLSGEEISTIVVDQNKVYVGNRTNGKIWYSTNNGQTFTTMNSPDSAYYSFDVYNGKLIIAPSFNYTTDDGQNWLSLNQPLPNNDVARMVAMNDDYLFACMYNDIYRLPISLLNSVNNNEADVETMIYPNPSGGECYLRNASQSKKEIRILTMEGKCLQKSQSSDSMIRLNTSNLSSGMYFVEISDGSQVVTQKLLLQ